MQIKKWFRILCLVLICMFHKAEAHFTGEILETGTSEEGFEYEIIEDGSSYVNILDYVGSATEITIPDTIKDYPVWYIDEEAFANQTQLKKVTISNNVKQIQVRAFKDCTNLKSITLPNNLLAFRISAFQGCTSLEEFLLNGESEQLKSIDGVLYALDIDGNLAVLVAYPGGKKNTSYMIPASVMAVFSGGQDDGEYGDIFYGNQSLEEILVEKDDSFKRTEGAIKVFGQTYYMFDRPSSLESIDGILLNGKDTIVSYPSGKKDETYVIPNTVTSIKAWAICENKYLRTLTIPDSVTVFANSGRTVHNWKEKPSRMDAIGQCFGVDSDGRPLPNFMVMCSEDSEAYGYIRCMCPMEIELKYEQFVGKIYYRTNVNGVKVEIPAFLEEGFFGKIDGVKEQDTEKNWNGILFIFVGIAIGLVAILYLKKNKKIC